MVDVGLGALVSQSVDFSTASGQTTLIKEAGIELKSSPLPEQKADILILSADLKTQQIELCVL